MDGAGRGCAEATWWPFVTFLSGVTGGDTTWNTLPKDIFRFGAGGVSGWGTICGTLNAAASVINMVVANGTHRTTLTNGIFQYYAETALPTNGAWKSYQNALGLGMAWTPTPLPMENVPSSTANSPLCHSSLVQKDRCGKACFDVARKLTEMLNAYFLALATPGVHAGRCSARSGRGRLRRVSRHVHGRQDGLWFVPRQHADRRPLPVNVPADGLTRTGARTSGRMWRNAL